MPPISINRNRHSNWHKTIQVATNHTQTRCKTFRQKLRIQIIILILITNFAFGQNKVSIKKNTVKYEREDEFNRFDDVENSNLEYEGLSINFKSNLELEIKNSCSSGFTGNDVSFVINDKLELINTTYDSWTDVIDLENQVTYKVKNVELILNQNPFKSISELRGNYILKVEEYWNQSLNKVKTYKGKFKSYKGINKSSADYLWALKQNRITNGIIDKNGVYLQVDKKASLKSGLKNLTKKIQQIKGEKPKRLKGYIVINENGKVEKESVKFLEYLDIELQKQIIKLLVEFTEWYPACVNEKEVKSRIPIVIGIE